MPTDLGVPYPVRGYPVPYRYYVRPRIPYGTRQSIT
jgi:hypothetical protein